MLQRVCSIRGEVRSCSDAVRGCGTFFWVGNTQKMWSKHTKPSFRVLALLINWAASPRLPPTSQGHTQYGGGRMSGSPRCPRYHHSRVSVRTLTACSATLLLETAPVRTGPVRHNPHHRFYVCLENCATRSTSMSSAGSSGRLPLGLISLKQILWPSQRFHVHAASFGLNAAFYPTNMRSINYGVLLTSANHWSLSTRRHRQSFVTHWRRRRGMYCCSVKSLPWSSSGFADGSNTDDRHGGAYYSRSYCLANTAPWWLWMAG